MSVVIRGMKMPKNCHKCPLLYVTSICDGSKDCPLVEIPPHGRLKKRLVYRGEVYNALEAERVKSLDGILTDPYKDGFHDGLKRALQILANEVDDAPTIIEAEVGG